MLDDLGALVVMPVLSPSSEFVASAFADPGMAIAFSTTTFWCAACHCG